VVDSATKLVGRSRIARSLSRFHGGDDRWSVHFLPFDDEPTMRGAVSVANSNTRILGLVGWIKSRILRHW
jgi:hypothetical protein